MRGLITGDWQLDFNNLSTAEKMVKEVVRIKKKHDIDKIINLGDLKQRYSPIDGRTLNFAMDVCAELKPDILLGNHDRYSLVTDIVSWFPALRRAGAITHDVPERVKFKGTELHFLPFRASISETKEGALWLAKQVKDKKNALLFFHQDLKGCKYNLQTVSTDSGLIPAHLKPSRYLYCLGGHIHLRQNVVENIWYVGSPFPMDWGEANQIKGYTIVDTETGEIEFIRSELPLLWDISKPRFKPNLVSEGDTVRVHVKVDPSEDIQEILNHAKRNIVSQFGNVIPVAVADYGEESKVELEDIAESVTVKKYVKETCPDTLRPDIDKVISYIAFKLKQSNISLRSNKEVKFLYAKGKNILSYKNIEIDYAEPGIRLITGHNKDWGLGRSNGAGKTNCLALPMVALFGTTLKGQKHDKWARRRTKKIAWVELGLQLSDGRKCVIYRSRRPHKLSITVNGKDESEGNRTEVTQKRIEDITGLTKESALYIDQKNISQLLTGTDRDKKLILEKVQNLEKYNQAKELVDEDIKATLDFEEQIRTRIDQVLSEKESIIEHTNVADADTAKVELKQLKGQLKNHKSDLELWSSKENLKEKIASLQKEAEALTTERYQYEMYAEQHAVSISRIYKTIKKVRDLQDQNCPTCHQSVGKKHIIDVEKEHLKNESKYKEKVQKYSSLASRNKKKERELRDRVQKLDIKQKERDGKLLKIRILIDNLKDEIERRESELNKIIELQSKLKVLKQEHKKLKAILVSSAHDRLFLEYSQEVLSRKGLPAYLNKLLCPKLNKVAGRYSEMFGDEEIKVRFTVEKGQLIANILNANGGEAVIDQSQGEVRTASTITTFALKDVQSPCNLMNLDEPGEGLDAINAKLFGRRLKEIGKTQSIFLATHNQAILSELMSEKVLEVTKQNGISTLRVIV